MGYRFQGQKLELKQPLEMLSHAIQFGSVQVPPSGQPIILMADAQTTGGYPKIANVIDADLGALAQVRLGSTIQFEAVSLEQAANYVVKMRYTSIKLGELSMKKIDLNADIAEGFPFDEALLRLLSSANIACGLHAGGAKEMQSAVRLAKENQVRIGAHPGFPDRENFGRTQMDLPDQELIAHLRYQLGALKAICDGEGAEISYVKPHGALYNQAAKR